MTKMSLLDEEDIAMDGILENSPRADGCPAQEGVDDAMKADEDDVVLPETKVKRKRTPSEATEDEDDRASSPSKKTSADWGSQMLLDDDDGDDDGEGRLALRDDQVEDLLKSSDEDDDFKKPVKRPRVAPVNEDSSSAAAVVEEGDTNDFMLNEDTQTNDGSLLHDDDDEDEDGEENERIQSDEAEVGQDKGGDGDDDGPPPPSSSSGPKDGSSGDVGGEQGPGGKKSDGSERNEEKPAKRDRSEPSAAEATVEAAAAADAKSGPGNERHRGSGIGPSESLPKTRRASARLAGGLRSRGSPPSSSVPKASSPSGSNKSSDCCSEEKVEESSSEEDEVGNPDKPPGEAAERRIDPDHLLPFYHGWRREVVMKQASASSATHCEIFYIPPSDTPFRTRESKRKRRSKADQEKYFEDFPHKQLSVHNFSYVGRPLGLNNAAYEIVRKLKKRHLPRRGVKDEGQQQQQHLRGSEFETAASSFSGGEPQDQLQHAHQQNQRQQQQALGLHRKNYKEVEESTGLLEGDSSSSGDEDDQEVRKTIGGFALGLPVSLQAERCVVGMRSLHRKRRRFRNPETSCTPPLAEDNLWSNLDDDPLGIYTLLGGRSSPTTPPPLRAVKLTPGNTATKIKDALIDIRREATVLSAGSLTDPETKEELVSHDLAIRRFKDVKPLHYKAAFAQQYHNPQFGDGQRLLQHPTYLSKMQPSSYPRGFLKSKGSSSPGSIMNPVVMRNNLLRQEGRANKAEDICGAHCVIGGVAVNKPPSAQCIRCSRLFHPQCHGKSHKARTLRCRMCRISLISQNHTDSATSNHDGMAAANKADGLIKVKLPMSSINGRRPVVELVVSSGPNGKFHPFRPTDTSVQFVEVISKRVFDEANRTGCTVYQPARRVPAHLLGNNLHQKILLAVNPSGKFRLKSASREQQQQQQPHQPHHQPQLQSHLQQQQQQQLLQSRQIVQQQKPPPALPTPLPDQVSITVRLLNGKRSKPVLLNVPRKVALKVKVGTTLSFSASSDQKYVVIDNTIHPPVKARAPPPFPPPAPSSSSAAGGSRNVRTSGQDWKPQQFPQQQVQQQHMRQQMHQQLQQQMQQQMQHVQKSRSEQYVQKSSRQEQQIQHVQQLLQLQQLQQAGQTPMPIELPTGLTISRTSTLPASHKNRARPAFNIPSSPLNLTPSPSPLLSSPNQLPALSISPINHNHQSMPAPSLGKRKSSSGSRDSILPGGSILSTGEVVASPGSVAMTPCTPYCPGVSGFPELECTGCQSLFHSKCVGIPQTAVDKIRAIWKCRMCVKMTAASSKVPPPVQVINLD